MTRPPLTKQRSTTAPVLATHRTRAHSQLGSRPGVTRLEHCSIRSTSQMQRKDRTLNGLNDFTSGTSEGCPSEGGLIGFMSA